MAIRATSSVTLHLSSWQAVSNLCSIRWLVISQDDAETADTNPSALLVSMILSAVIMVGSQHPVELVANIPQTMRSSIQ